MKFARFGLPVLGFLAMSAAGSAFADTVVPFTVFGDSGIGSFTLDLTPAGGTYFGLGGDITALTLTLDGETFSLTDGGAGTATATFDGTHLTDLTFVDAGNADGASISIGPGNTATFFAADGSLATGGVDVPEPAAAGLLALPLLALGMVRRRRA